MNKKIPFQNKEIHYRVIGNGASVVLIHGFGEDGTVWDNQVDALKDYFKLIVPDLPGSGLSPILNGACTIEILAESIYTILKGESITSTVVIGHSMGGYITLAFAEKYPQMLKGFGLFHSSAYPDNDEKKEARRKSIGFIQQQGAAKFIEQLIPKLFSEGFKQENPLIVKELIQRYTNFSAEALVQYYEAMILRPDRAKQLRDFAGPILIIMGKQDSVIPLEDNLSQSHLPHIAYIQLLEKSGHMGMLEETANANKFLQKFLTEIEIVRPVPAL